MSVTRPPFRFPLRATEDARTVGVVRRLDSGRTPSRHPAVAVRWPDDRRPRPKRVEGPATPVADALRKRLHEADVHVPVSAMPLARRGNPALPGAGGSWADDEDDDAPPGAPPRAPARVGVGAARRSRRRRGGVEANARLTGATAAVLLVLLSIEGFTIMRIFPLLSIHVFVGMLLIPIVLVKIGSVLWRFAKYYLGDPEYRRRGPPAPLLRLLGPVVIVLTLTLLVSGVALLLVAHDGAARDDLLRVHQVSFVLWFMVMVAHVLGHILDTATLAPRDWYWRTRRQVRGASARQWVLVSSVAMGLIAGAVMLPYVGAWLAGVQPAAHAVVHAVHPAGHRFGKATR
jgi:hypothetical protein